MRESSNLKDFLYSEEFIPKFRDADPDGLLGARGYFNLFQDMTSAHMYLYGLGNDELPERTGCAWIFTKYRLHIFEKTGFTGPIRAETWAEPVKSPLLVHHALVISDSLDGRVLCEGRVESCPFNLKEQKLEKLSVLGYKDDISLDRRLELNFSRINRSADRMEYRYTHEVVYTDLDKSEHMNNIRYIDMFLNAFSLEFYRENRLADFEIQYINQCFEGEQLRILLDSSEEAGLPPGGHNREAGIAALKKERAQGIKKFRLLAQKEDETVAASALISVIENNRADGGKGLE